MAGVPLGEEDTTEEPTGKTLLGLGPDGAGEELAGTGVTSVTGQTVVEMAIVEVVTTVESAGQLVTLAAQLVMVISLVVYTVEVVIWTGVLIAGVLPKEVLAAGVLPAGVVTGRTEDPGTEAEGTTMELEPAGPDE